MKDLEELYGLKSLDKKVAEFEKKHDLRIVWVSPFVFRMTIEDDVAYIKNELIKYLECEDLKLIDYNKSEKLGWHIVVYEMIM